MLKLSSSFKCSDVQHIQFKKNVINDINGLKVKIMIYMAHQDNAASRRARLSEIIGLLGIPGRGRARWRRWGTDDVDAPGWGGKLTGLSWSSASGGVNGSILSILMPRKQWSLWADFPAQSWIFVTCVLCGVLSRERGRSLPLGPYGVRSCHLAFALISDHLVVI